MFHNAHAFALVALLAAVPSWASAEQLRLRYVPMDAAGTMTQVPAGPDGNMGEVKRGLGLRAIPHSYVVKPNQMVTFRHPFNGKNATVPIRLPSGTPRMEHRSDRIIYNYGDYTVEARFNPDGSIDMVYNSGLLRPLRLN
ncbi:MAG: hypothetical protein EXR98_17915 [Gemmataceae bacterium]|nr:hypothetical protein [Gemmataceae bacterium]